VRLRVSAQSHRVDLHTGITLTPKQWGKDRVKQGCVVDGMDYNILNDSIRAQEDYIATYFRNCALRSELVDLENLKRQFNYAFKASPQMVSDDFFYVMQSYIDNTAQTKSWSARYKDEWERVMSGLHRFQPSTSWGSFTESYMNDYLKFLAKTMLNEKIDKNLEKVREFLKWAKLKKYPVNDDFFLYKPKLPSSHKEVRYLTTTEVSHLLELDLNNRIALEQTRDFFVFQCFTGLRYSDLQKLKRTNIIQEGEEYCLDILTKKDKDRIHYKLPKNAVSIYLKYAEFEYDDNALFPVLSNQKYNEHLKELGEIAGIEGEYVDYQCRLSEVEEVYSLRRDMQSHDARRTFVVMALNMGIDLNTIALLTSHSDLKAMRPYVQLNDKGKDKVIDAINAAFEG
jgi:site-specific recombinase XerD